VNHFTAARDVANAVLYEGYILYPYTASARKNHIRWQFGVIVPLAYAEHGGTGEPARAQTELLLEAGDETEVNVMVRFLQIEMRQVEAWTGTSFAPIGRLTVGGQTYVTFDEGVEREVSARFCVSPGNATAVPIAFSANETVELLREPDDTLRGRIVRRRWPLHGAVVAELEALASRTTLYKLHVRVENRSVVVAGERSSALRTAFVSTHTLLHATSGTFLSSLDPPPYAIGVTPLVNLHTWPVLVGDQAADPHRSALVLSSPIILYDFPAVARQSEGDTFDATEVDELMMLSVLSLPEEERAEARATDPRARAIVERAERFDARELARLHGTLLQTKYDSPRVPDPFSTLDIPGMDCVFVDGVKIAKGSQVRLHPKRRADVWDGFMEGKIATVRAIHQDMENVMYVAVTVDEDPASDLHDWYGRAFFFYPDEVEPLGLAVRGA
jgi:hypothetical protein